MVSSWTIAVQAAPLFRMEPFSKPGDSGSLTSKEGNEVIEMVIGSLPNHADAVFTPYKISSNTYGSPNK